MTPDEEPTGKRRAILTAGEKVFKALGYDAATVDAVATEAGIAKGSIYNYFESKRDLFAQVFTDIMVRHERDLDELLAQYPSASEKFEGYLDYWGASMGPEDQFCRIVLEFWVATAREEGGAGTMREMFRSMYAHWRGKIARIVRAGIAAGEFSEDVEPEIFAGIVVAVMDGLSIHMMADVGVIFDGQVMDRLKRELLASLHGWGGRAGPQQAKDQSDDR